MAIQAIQATATGPLFRADIPVGLRLGLNGGMRRAVDYVFAAAQAKYAGIRRGPGRYGHLATSLRARVQFTPDGAIGIVGPEGKAAFKARFLELGTTHRDFTVARRRRGQGRSRGGRRPPLRFAIGGSVVFRQWAKPGDIAPRRYLQQVEHATTPHVVELLGQALTEQLNG